MNIIEQIKALPQADSWLLDKTGQAKLKTLAESHERLLETTKLTVGFCVDARVNWDDWQKHPEVGTLFAIATTAIEQAERLYDV